jgi:GNAT superfamily N-acetyltransferase
MKDAHCLEVERPSSRHETSRTGRSVIPEGEPAPSPKGIGADVRTKQGTVVYLRPINAEDAADLVQFHEHLSPQSVYRRFFFMHPHLSPRETDRFTHVDGVDRVALVVENGERLIAVGRYERLPGTTDAEVAFVVADESQHQGIGSLLLQRLADAALENGITTFVAQTLCENRAMLAVFARSGFPMSCKTKFGTVSIRLLLIPTGVVEGSLPSADPAAGQKQP